jgi:hypothetical protein
VRLLKVEPDYFFFVLHAARQFGPADAAPKQEADSLIFVLSTR